jgi:hypothetical protein
MSRVELPPKPGDDLDGLLRAFFRGQMPNPWPAPRLPRFRTATPARPAPPGRPLMRSRWALAASVGLLLLGSLGLTGRFTQPTRHDASFDGPMTGDTKELKQIKDEGKVRDFEKKNAPGLGADEFNEFDLSPVK